MQNERKVSDKGKITTEQNECMKEIKTLGI